MTYAPNSRAAGTNESPLDRFARRPAALAVASLWGLAEATLFFIVPDVFLTFLGIRRLSLAVRASLGALAGALVGGALMYAFGAGQTSAARALLEAVPGIQAPVIDSAVGQIDRLGLWAVLLGPVRGIPYKIYAVEWGAAGGSFWGFLLISVPARYIRFFLAAAVANLLARALAPLTRRRAGVESAILCAVWVAFYAFYFSRFGW